MVSSTIRACPRSRASAMAASASRRPSPWPRAVGRTKSRFISAVRASSWRTPTQPCPGASRSEPSGGAYFPGSVRSSSSNPWKQSENPSAWAYSRKSARISSSGGPAFVTRTSSMALILTRRRLLAARTACSERQPTERSGDQRRDAEREEEHQTFSRRLLDQLWLPRASGSDQRRRGAGDDACDRPGQRQPGEEQREDQEPLEPSPSLLGGKSDDPRKDEREEKKAGERRHHLFSRRASS